LDRQETENFRENTSITEENRKNGKKAGVKSLAFFCDKEGG
jgi:hypothetical protein